MLRRGITGFGADQHVEFRDFKRAVYTAARTIGGSVVASQAGDQVTPNFHLLTVAMEYGDVQFCVLCNRNYPVVAIVRPPIEMSGVQPVEVPLEFVQSLRASGFEVASTIELNRAVSADDLKTLSKHEQKQATYWKPARIADVIFNWWD
jgi:hypothetical protein